MKTILKAGLVVGSLSLGWIACKKDSHNSQTPGPLLTLSKSSVKLEEPVFATTTAGGSAHAPVVRWSTSPATSNWFSTSSNGSIILFSNPGHYIVTASLFADSLAGVPYDSSSSAVTVTDSVYSDTLMRCDAIKNIPMGNGDVITLVPVSYTDTGLVLVAHTQYAYANNPVIEYYTLPDTVADYATGFGTILQFPCEQSAGPSPGTAIVSLKGLTNGTHSLVFSSLGINYTGSLTVTNTDCSFSWNYSSGVTISPLHISR